MAINVIYTVEVGEREYDIAYSYEPGCPGDRNSPPDGGELMGEEVTPLLTAYEQKIKNPPKFGVVPWDLFLMAYASDRVLDLKRATNELSDKMFEQAEEALRECWDDER